MVAPSAIHITAQDAAEHGGNTLPGPLKPSGALDRYTFRETTPPIGRLYEGVQLSDWLALPQEEGDRLIKELALTISTRGVVFFRDQDVTTAQQKELVARLSRLTGAPASSGYHVHLFDQVLHEGDREVTVIGGKKGLGAVTAGDKAEKSQFAANQWHSDITWEVCPSDYASLILHTIPATGGGDTLWASATAAYDRLSLAMRAFLEGLTAVHSGEDFREIAGRLGCGVNPGPRGNPLNVGTHLQAVHPVIRVNPVTGLKSIFVNRTFTKRIVELSKDESDAVLGYLFSLVALNHDIQTRFSWEPRSLALWDNRSTWHSATPDLVPGEIREGLRASTVGEKPFFRLSQG